MKVLLWLKAYGDDLCLFATLELVVLQQAATSLGLSSRAMAWASFLTASLGVAHKVFLPAARPPKDQ